MKNNPFQDGLLTPKDVELVEALADAAWLPFHRQARAAGIDPANDLQHSDLSGIEVSFADLSGFNFTGANLTDVIGVGTTWDTSTVFEGADLDGSVFALPVRQNTQFADPEARQILDRLSRGGFNEKVLWAADNLRARPDSEAVKAVVLQLFLDAEDHSLKSQLLYFVSPRMSNLQIKELLLTSLSSQFLSGPAVRTALALIKRRGMLRDPGVRRMLVSLLEAPSPPVREQSLSMLIQNGVQRPEAKAIFRAMNSYPHLGTFYVQRMAASLGEEYKLVVRHPVTGDTFALRQEIDDITLYLIARRWLKLAANIGEERQKIPLSERTPSVQVFEEPAVRARMHLVISLLDKLKTAGIRYDYDGNAYLNVIPNLPTERIHEKHELMRIRTRRDASGMSSAFLEATGRMA